MRVLFTFTGFHDPFSKGLLDEEEQPGPILSLVENTPFDQVVLISTPQTDFQTKETEKALQTTSPQLKIVVSDLYLNDPTDYSEILSGLRQQMIQFLPKFKDDALFIAVASGTPQMHACWLMLVTSGEFPAKILHVRPPRFVTSEMPMVSEVDIDQLAFSDSFLKNTFREDTSSVRYDACEDLDENPPLHSLFPMPSIPDFNKVVAELSLVAEHPSIRKALEMGATLADSGCPILVTGETGTGKELFAKMIHRLSSRHKQPFVPLNCAAIPEELIESILFGHRKGSFTGAYEHHDGKFVQADRGTLFLDELGDLPLAAQAKLLRVLQEGVVEPLGSKEGRKVDVRIVAATNMDLTTAIRQGKFRNDLYYRLTVGIVQLPPLRERHGDISKIALHVLVQVNRSLRHPKSISKDALKRLSEHTWPGNIRELANVIERSARLCHSPVLNADDLLISEPVPAADPLSMLPEPHESFSMEEFFKSARKQFILRALEKGSGSQSQAARLLGISPQAVNKFLQENR